MNKTVFLKITNLCLFISMLAQLCTGIVLFFDLFTGKPKLFEMITQIHRYNGVTLAVLVIAHLLLNWGWIKVQFLKRSA